MVVQENGTIYAKVLRYKAIWLIEVEIAYAKIPMSETAWNKGQQVVC